MPWRIKLVSPMEQGTYACCSLYQIYSLQVWGSSQPLSVCLTFLSAASELTDLRKYSGPCGRCSVSTKGLSLTQESLVFYQNQTMAHRTGHPVGMSERGHLSYSWQRLCLSNQLQGLIPTPCTEHREKGMPLHSHMQPDTWAFSLYFQEWGQPRRGCYGNFCRSFTHLPLAEATSYHFSLE